MYSFFRVSSTSGRMAAPASRSSAAPGIASMSGIMRNQDCHWFGSLIWDIHAEAIACGSGIFMCIPYRIDLSRTRTLTTDADRRHSLDLRRLADGADRAHRGGGVHDVPAVLRPAVGYCILYNGWRQAQTAPRAGGGGAGPGGRGATVTTRPGAYLIQIRLAWRPVVPSRR